MDRGRTALVLSEVMTKSQSAVEKTSAKSLSSQWRVRILSMGLFSQPAAGGNPPGLLGGARRGAERQELGQALMKGLDVVQGLHASRHAELDIVAKPRGPLQHHQGPDPLAGERLGGLGDLVEEMALLLASRPRHHLEEGALAEVREGPAELGLEEHDERQHPEGPEIVE